MLRRVFRKYRKGISKNKGIPPSGTLSQILDLENLATAHRPSASAIQTATAGGVVLTTPGGDGPTVDVQYAVGV